MLRLLRPNHEGIVFHQRGSQSDEVRNPQARVAKEQEHPTVLVQMRRKFHLFKAFQLGRRQGCLVSLHLRWLEKVVRMLSGRVGIDPLFRCQVQVFLDVLVVLPYRGIGELPFNTEFVKSSQSVVCEIFKKQPGNICVENLVSLVVVFLSLCWSLYCLLIALKK